MTKEQMRVKVAELCGWKQLDWHHSIRLLFGVRPGETRFYPQATMTVTPIPVLRKSDVPNYPEDLNACHAFESTLNERQRFLFGKILWELVPTEMWHATAEQRCRAFIATLEDTR